MDDLASGAGMSNHHAMRRACVLGVDVDVINQDEVTGRVMALAGGAAALVVTANLDHAVRLRRDERLGNLYRTADLVLADGFPLVWASILRGPRLPGRVTGADLIEPVCAAAARAGASVFVVGTKLGVLTKACRRLARQFPGLAIVGAHSPSFGFDVGHPECDEVAAMIRAVAPDIVFVALGSPKQERWAAAYMHRLPPAVYICTGAGFDYLAGQPPRAPKLVRQMCLEWAWRLAREPRRLARRYAVDLLHFPLLLALHLGWLRSPGNPARSQPDRAAAPQGPRTSHREPAAVVELDAYNRPAGAAGAEPGRGAEVRFLGDIPRSPETVPGLAGAAREPAAAPRSAAGSRRR
jgi:N-acetylglucosaminyldiphosphoundecaprenol N-acetyl-beta-D-mannosaminyltransferase